MSYITTDYVFRKDLYEKYDQKSKEKIKDWILLNLIDDKETKGPDLIVKENPIVTGYIEAEVKEFGWREGNFWPQTVHILYRKKRLIDKYGKVTFFVLNHDMTNAVVVHGIDLKDRYLKEIPNKRHRSGEYMYDIPMRLCEVINLDQTYEGDFFEL